METGRYLERIPYVKGGSGEKTIIILPGSFDFVLSVELDPKAAYKRYMSLLPGGYKFCILGYDRNLPDTATLESMADEFASIIKENFDTPVTLAGASYGGSISVYLASRHPELVERLLLFSSAHKLAKPAGLNFLKLVIEAASSLDVKPFEKAFH
ncbi:MAG: alpha/beta fold hydrolase, partial [Candidatus Hodarchaeota archaeon]